MSIVYAYPHTEVPRQSQEEREAIARHLKAGKVTKCPPADCRHWFGSLIAVEGTPPPPVVEVKASWNQSRQSGGIRALNAQRRAQKNAKAIVFLARWRELGGEISRTQSGAIMRKLSKETGIRADVLRDIIRRGRELEQREAAE